MTLYCDNKGALNNAFKVIKPGISPYFNTDHDLIELAQALVTLIPIVISTSWVKGHYTGKARLYQHDLNDTADRIAGEYQKQQTPHFTIRKPLPTPNYRIRLLYDASVLTAKVQSTLVSSLHGGNIEMHIMRKANWTRTVFNKIHWDAHEKAFKRLPRYSQHSTAKLIHGLINTNRQNFLFYGQSALCPICQQTEETMEHLFTCPHPDAKKSRQQSLSDLQDNLRMINTPIPVIEAIIHGYTVWEQDPTRRSIRALTAGSLRGPDAVLTSAFREQFSEIGSLHFNLGRISIKWASAVSQYIDKPAPEMSQLWASVLIAALWRYSHSQWRYRNTVVHGASVKEQATRRILDLRHQITQHYDNFTTTPNLVLPRHRNLFTTKTLEERIKTTYDSMAAWLRSVEEALQVVQHHESQLRSVSQTFFGGTISVHSDTDSSYSNRSTSTYTTTSLEPTTATTDSYTTLSKSTSTDGRFTCLHYDSDDNSVQSDISTSTIRSAISQSSGEVLLDHLVAHGQNIAPASSDVFISGFEDSSFNWDVH